MKIALPAYDAAGWTAGAVFTEMMVRSLRLIGGDDLEIIVFTAKGAESKVRWQGLATAIDEPVRSLFDRAVTKFGWHAPDAVERYCARNGVDALLLYSRIGGKRARFRRVPWIPDFQHKVLPHYFSEEEKENRDRAQSRCARLSDTMLFSSQAVLDDYARFYPDLAHKGRVGHFPSLYGLVPPSEPLAIGPDRYGLPEKFVLVANQYWSHKNHLAVIEAVALLAERGIDIHVAFTGLPSDYRSPTNDSVSNMMQAIASRGLAGRVVPLGLIPKNHLTDLMRAACVVIQPSRFEGWSTVVQDAKALGRPLICSDLPVHREQAPDCLGFFDCDSPETLAGILAEKWETLTAGPNMESEQKGLNEARECAVAYGRVLMDVCG